MFLDRRDAHIQANTLETWYKHSNGKFLDIDDIIIYYVSPSEIHWQAKFLPSVPTLLYHEAEEGKTKEHNTSTPSWFWRTIFSRMSGTSLPTTLKQ